MKKKFFNEGIRFECQGSGKCCVSRGSIGYVYLTNNDINRFAKYLKLNKKQFIKTYCKKDNEFIYLKEINRNGDCIFLDNKRCTVYRARPNQCRSWPFWPENMNSKTWTNEIENFCPGVGKGKLYSKKEIMKIINKDKFDINSNDF